MEQKAIVIVKSEHSKTLMESLRPESEDEMLEGKVELSGNDDILQLEFTSRQISQLRAGLNAYMRWLKAMEETIENVRMCKDGNVP